MSIFDRFRKKKKQGELQEEVKEEIKEEIQEELQEEIQEELQEELQEEIMETDEAGDGRGEDIPADEPVYNEPVYDELEEIKEEIKAEKKGFFSRIAAGLGKTRKNIQNSFDNILKNFKRLDDELFDELEEALIMADIGAQTSMEIIDILRKSAKENKISTAYEVKELLASEIAKILTKDSEPFELKPPTIILVVGVNGVGKTTSIGKLSARFISEGKKVIAAAGDTFRAAAIDQLEVWANRSGAQLIKHQENSDPGAVVFDAIKAAQARGADVLICDTAGRLQNKKNLMEELRKVSKIVEREFPEAKKEVFLVLDATTGQNALSQAQVFKEITQVTGVILTKLDGTAKGGIVVPIKRELGLNVRFVCIGEGVDDIEPFEAEQFARALFMDDKEENNADAQ